MFFFSSIHIFYLLLSLRSTLVRWSSLFFLLLRPKMQPPPPSPHQLLPPPSPRHPPQRWPLAALPAQAPPLVHPCPARKTKPRRRRCLTRRSWRSCVSLTSQAEGGLWSASAEPNVPKLRLQSSCWFDPHQNHHRLFQSLSLSLSCWTWFQQLFIYFKNNIKEQNCLGGGNAKYVNITIICSS